MSAVSFSSVSEASAAFTLGPVRFHCNVCDGVHSSRGKGWFSCARKHFSEPRGSLRKSSGKLFGHLSCTARTAASFSWWDYLGRDFLHEVGWRQILPPAVGPVPEILAVERSVREETERQVLSGWWVRVAEELLWLRGLLLEKFPEGFRKPLLPLLSVGGSPGGPALFLEDLAVSVGEDYRRMHVVHFEFYCGADLRAEAPSAEEAAGGLRAVLSVLGVSAFRPVLAGTRVVFEGVSS